VLIDNRLTRFAVRLEGATLQLGLANSLRLELVQMEECAMSEPEYSIQFKMTVKGRDAVRTLHWRFWSVIAAVVLLAMSISGLSKLSPSTIWNFVTRLQ
jgi:hypothetical protein